MNSQQQTEDPQNNSNDQDQTGQQDTKGFESVLKIADMVNVCDLLEDDEITKIGRDVVRLTKLDDDSRSAWKEKSKDAMDLALQVVEERTINGRKGCNVKYPLITTAALQFHARAYPAIIQGNKVVKGQVTGPDDQGEKNQQAMRIAAHMNWQLLEQNEDWEEEADKLLLALPIEGCEFKKSYFDKNLGFNVSEWVRPEDFIVNNMTKSLARCPRATHRLWFYPYEIDEKVGSGLWREANLNISQEDDDDQVLQEFYEQHAWLDVDEDDIKEPYVILTHVKSEEVVRIAPCFYKEDIVVEWNGTTGKVGDLVKGLIESGVQPDQAEEVLKDAKFKRVEKIDYFTKIPFIPSPDGSFYDLGFGQLAGPLTDTVDTIINQLIDAGINANLQGGFVREGISVSGQRGDILIRNGEFVPIKIPATSSIQDSLFQFKFSEPSLVLYQLLGMLVGSVKDITGVQDIMMGGKDTNETATTTMARVEQGLKIFSAIYKRIYRSLKQEFKKLYKLNARFLNPEEYFRVLDTQEVQKIGLRDYQNDGTDVQPVADPQLATTMMAMAKAQSLLMLLGKPGINNDDIIKRYIDALELPSPQSLIIPPDQRPKEDPQMQLRVMEAASRHAKTQAEIIGIYGRFISDIANAESKELGPQLEYYKTYLEGMIKEWGTDGQGTSQGMESGPVDQGGVQPPAGDQEPVNPGMPGAVGPQQG